MLYIINFFIYTEKKKDAAPEQPYVQCVHHSLLPIEGLLVRAQGKRSLCTPSLLALCRPWRSSPSETSPRFLKAILISWGEEDTSRGTAGINAVLEQKILFLWHKKQTDFAESLKRLSQVFFNFESAKESPLCLYDSQGIKRKKAGIAKLVAWLCGFVGQGK